VAALVFMTRTSTPWSLLPAKELGCGSVSTCWRRLDEWAHAGGFDQLQAVLLDELGVAGRIDLDRVSVDSFSLRAVKGDLTGANPVDRGKAGSKLHVAGEASGLPLSVVVSAANANDSTMWRRCLTISHRSVGVEGAHPTQAVAADLGQPAVIQHGMVEGLGMEQVQGLVGELGPPGEPVRRCRCGHPAPLMAVVLLCGPWPGVGGTERSSMA
jgi:transposase